MAKQKKATRGFRPEVIKKVVSLLLKMIAYYRAILDNGGFIKLVTSSGNRKIGRCLNVSLAPIVTCGNCSKCKQFCYDVKAVLQYVNVLYARAKNTALFEYSRELFFAQLWTKMERRKKNLFLRFHVSGEIKDINHLEWIIKTAEKFPQYKIWTYTKMYWTVNQYIMEHGGNKDCLPANLSIMFSEWKGLPIYNPYNMPVFRCIYPEETAPADCMLCPGNCDVCKAENRGCIVGQSSYVHLH